MIAKLRNGCRVRVYPHDVIGKNIYIEGVFEPESCNFVRTHLQPGMTVFDLGANLGQYTLLGAKCVGESGRVHSFEPSDRMFQELRHNVALNDLDELCVLNNVAVSDKCGTEKLSVHTPGNEVYGSLGSSSLKGVGLTGYREVETVTLDHYVQEARIDRVDFMKMDIEGAELLALRGGERLLSRPDAPVILLEVLDTNMEGFGYSGIDIWDYLEGFGYCFYKLAQRGYSLEALDRPQGFSMQHDLVAMKSR